MRKYKRKPKEQKRIAMQRMDELFVQADKIFSKDSALADRYVELARKISMKYKVRMRPALKRRFCKHCYKFLVPGNNCRVRLQKGKVVYYCISCKKHTRLPYATKKS